MASKLNIQEIESTTGTLKVSGNVKLDMSGSNDYMHLPAGTSDQRGNPEEGAIRWNYDYDSLEVYNGTTWKILNKSKDTDNIVKAGLIVHLDASLKNSYPGNGDTWYDLSGSDISPVRKNGVTYTTQVGGEFNFDGVNDKFNFPNKTISNGNFLTIDIWAKVNDGTRYQDIFDVVDTYGIWIVANNYAGASPGKIVTSFATTTGSIQGSYTVGEWFNVIFVGNGGITRQYINGTLTSTGSQNVPNNINFNNARIGNVDGDRANEYLNGSVASLKIYDRALSQEEVTQNFNALRGRFGV